MIKSFNANNSIGGGRRVMYGHNQVFRVWVTKTDHLLPSLTEKKDSFLTSFFSNTSSCHQFRFCAETIWNENKYYIVTHTIFPCACVITLRINNKKKRRKIVDFRYQQTYTTQLTDHWLKTTLSCLADLNAWYFF